MALINETLHLSLIQTEVKQVASKRCLVLLIFILKRLEYVKKMQMPQVIFTKKRQFFASVCF